MKIVEPHEKIVVRNAAMLIYGEPGIGKSSLGNTANDPIILDYDNGQHRAKNRRRVIQPEGDNAEVLAWLEANAANYGDVVVDTAGRLLDAYAAEIIQGEPKRGRGGMLDQQGWGLLGQKFAMFKNRVTALKKDLILLAHHKEEKDGDAKVVRADVQGGARNEIMKSVEFAGFLYASDGKRVLDFSPSQHNIGKNPCGWEPFVIPHYDENRTFLADLLARGKAGLGEISAEALVVNEAVSSWADALKDADDAKAFNALKAKLAEEKDEKVKAAVWKRILSAAKAADVPYDKSAKTFVAKAA